MGRFEILPHTADVGFRATGDTLVDLFETAARAMLSVEYDPAAVTVEEERPLEAGAGDLGGLMEAWLSELVWLHDALCFVPGTVSVGHLDDRGPELHVSGAAGGCRIGDWFEQTGPQIKAVTMHGLDVRQTGGGWEAVVYLDV